MKILLLCFAFYLPYALCIIGGNDVQKNIVEPHFVVSLRKMGAYRHFCGGSLIASKFVLTAASCVKDQNLKDVFGYVGASNVDSSKERVMIYFDKVFFKDPTGQKLVRNNIALLHLKDRITHFDMDKVQIIDFSSDTDIATNGARCKVFGWGQTDRLRNESTNILQETWTSIEDFKTCKYHNSDVDESNICTYCSTASCCNFDAGTPLASTDVLWGIATEDYACSESPILGDVFTRVDSHKDWIEKTIEENSSKQHKPHTVIMSTCIIMLLKTWLHL
ncbi:chymotrypsin-like elastase family member 2A [Bradysia coprophila]|uniref:chymotrypsin-like elastase family member 2A n=1 Tax=Bradysia coprophila TaxID=38358 RepID=UPI00187D8B5E|nr:chymotrypsin-like elastase family member 2A [Bradysia coprophila]